MRRLRRLRDQGIVQGTLSLSGQISCWFLTDKDGVPRRYEIPTKLTLKWSRRNLIASSRSAEDAAEVVFK